MPFHPLGQPLPYFPGRSRLPKDHPLRTIKAVADEALERLPPEFDKMYSRVGRASVNQSVTRTREGQQLAEAKATVQQEWVDRHYTQGQPKDKRRNFLRSCNYAMFRRLVRSGEIDQHLETKANECRQHAEALID